MSASIVNSLAQLNCQVLQYFRLRVLNYNWSLFSVIYRCIQPPPKVSNGEWIGNTSYVTIECHPDHSVISGDEILICPKEEWEGVPPVCQKS